MKSSLKTHKKKQIPTRFVWAISVTFIQTAAIIAMVLLLKLFVPYFDIAIILTQIYVLGTIVSSDENPDFKIPWLLVVLLLPIAGFMIYFIFGKRDLSKNYVARMEKAERSLQKSGNDYLKKLQKVSPQAYADALLIERLSENGLYMNTQVNYFPSGEAVFESMLTDLRHAEKFIFIESFIIEEGLFWNSILEILLAKVKAGVEVKVIYDDIGSMLTLPGDYYQTLTQMGIEAVPFAFLKGQASSEFNNRSHRKIMIIDGQIAYTGGINLADEYINEIEKFGYWKDVGIRLNGEATNELTNLFLIDYYTNQLDASLDFSKYYLAQPVVNDSFVLPFGDGPSPVYSRHVSKQAIINLLASAKYYVHITTPYLIVDDELANAIERTALRGVDVKIITPGIPDKKIIFAMSRANYVRLLNSGVEIYEYTPGFIHSKIYLADGQVGIIGTVNLDYRSLVHHFENSVWLYQDAVLTEIEADFLTTLAESRRVSLDELKKDPLHKIINILLRAFSPLL
ncbi:MULTISPECIES: cardiolipin synthase [unclassified Enterococcus]|uniref:cardiolipin synthase n=1 Tax=unclassified Enterococcus TaxID=2608891 RepID=UPI001553FED3|nr:MULTISPECIES: cardiolipin synthase [unclassified Enterococcus]MBS7578226.1 cardiolipin synthase [Enterococcus sp. MMGLQ5-2]MBS7585535.1 cardiolipin synthase [Enterococcus sp. MMGLQ5-1]NPD13394.1 cardiolipin synthase [Enterococcus sp. MMGLQ5-1]NPD38057.1 cardiolipin synthase [Enterococcus sp. MMGLQ5-2]